MCLWGHMQPGSLQVFGQPLLAQPSMPSGVAESRQRQLEEDHAQRHVSMEAESVRVPFLPSSSPVRVSSPTRPCLLISPLPSHVCVEAPGVWVFAPHIKECPWFLHGC